MDRKDNLLPAEPLCPWCKWPASMPKCWENGTYKARRALNHGKAHINKQQIKLAKGEVWNDTITVCSHPCHGG